MRREMKLTIDALPTSDTGLGFNNNKLELKISATENNGLDIVDGKLTATKAPDGTPGGGSMNLPGNGVGPTDATSSTALGLVGLNPTVSRKKKAPSSASASVKSWDGPVMAKVTSSTYVASGSIAEYMISYDQSH